MDSADVSRTSLKKEKPPKSTSQIEFERLRALFPSQTKFYEFYSKHGYDNLDEESIKNRIEKHVQRNSKESFFKQHLKAMILFCEQEGVAYDLGVPDFMINSLHDDPKIAREIFDALSSLDWSNEGDGS